MPPPIFLAVRLATLEIALSLELETRNESPTFSERQGYL